MELTGATGYGSQLLVTGECSPLSTAAKSQWQREVYYLYERGFNKKVTKSRYNRG